MELKHKTTIPMYPFLKNMNKYLSQQKPSEKPALLHPFSKIKLAIGCGYCCCDHYWQTIGSMMKTATN